MEIRIDAKTRIINADDVKVKGRVVDFARDRLLILDSQGRPVATCQPIPDVQSSTAVSSQAPAISAPKAEDGEDQPARGRLSEANTERLQRIWQEHPNWEPQKIADAFRAATGLAITAERAAKARPEFPDVPPGAPTPAEIREKAETIKSQGLAAMKARG